MLPPQHHNDRAAPPCPAFIWVLGSRRRSSCSHCTDYDLPAARSACLCAGKQMTRPMSHGTWETRTETADHGGLLERPALEDTPQSSGTAPHIRKSQPPDQHLITYHMVGSVSTSTLGCSTAQLASLLPQVAGSQNNWPSISREFLTHPTAALGNVDIKLIKFFEFY